MIKTLSIKEVEYLASRLATEKITSNEPIPDSGTLFPNALEGSLAVPFQTFQRKPLYKGLASKAAILFYLMIKNHPFQNGNKRIALTTLFAFLYKNKKWLEVDNRELYNFVMWVTASPSKLKNDVLKAIESFLKEYLVPLK